MTTETSSSGVISSSNDAWRTPKFWKKLCPNLTIGQKLVGDAKTNIIPEDVASNRRQNLQDNGFALVNDSMPSSLVDSLRKGIETLHTNNYPASFILLFDAAWELASHSRHLTAASTSPHNQFQWDILAWYIDGGGFSPHRDRQPDNAKASFHKEDAKFVTHWIALSQATPENSCLYVIPKSQDPGYLEGDFFSDDEDPLRRALPDKNAFQQIRALPRNSGESLLFTHRLIHWGSARPQESTLPPRIAISFVCSDPTFEKPYLDSSKYFPDPPFPIRLLLVCAQLLIYYQRFDLSKETIQACYEYVKEHESELDPDYRNKVYVEFVKAMKEFKESEPNSRYEDSDAEEEAVLEEMLNAEQGGYGEFQDDYDDEAGDDADEMGKGVGEDHLEDEDEFEEEEGFSLFGQPKSKKSKPNT